MRHLLSLMGGMPRSAAVTQARSVLTRLATLAIGGIEAELQVFDLTPAGRLNSSGFAGGRVAQLGALPGCQRPLSSGYAQRNRAS